MEIDSFLYLSILVTITFASFLFTNSYFKRMSSLFLLTLFIIAILDLKISEVSNVNEGLNILVYVIPVIMTFLIFYRSLMSKLKD